MQPIYLSERSPQELLAVIVGSSNAEMLWRKYPSMRRIGMLSLAELIDLGLPTVRANQLPATLDIARIYSIESAPKLRRVSGHNLGQNLSMEMQHLDKEVARVLSMNIKDEILADEVISVGTANACLIHPRDVFKPAILRNATSIILVHNHPSGDPTPSLEDINLTNKLKLAGENLSIRLREHYIAGFNGKYVSIIGEGYI